MLESGNKQASDKFTWRKQDYCLRFLFAGPCWRSRVSSNHVTSNTLAQANCVFLWEGLSVGPSEPSKPCCRGLARCFAVRAFFFFFEHVDSSAITHPFLLSSVDASPCSTMTRVELDLHVKTIVLLTSRGARRRNVH